MSLPLSEGRTELRFGGRFQTQYATSSVDGSNPEFFMRRARLIADDCEERRAADKRM